MYTFIIDIPSEVGFDLRRDIYVSGAYQTPELLMRGLNTVEFYRLAAAVLFECRKMEYLRDKYGKLAGYEPTFRPKCMTANGWRPTDPRVIESPRTKTHPFDEEIIRYACNVGDKIVIGWLNSIRRWLKTPENMDIDDGNALCSIHRFDKYIRFYPVPRTTPPRDERMELQTPPTEEGRYILQQFMPGECLPTREYIVEIRPNREFQVEVRPRLNIPEIDDEPFFFKSVRTMLRSYRKAYPNLCYAWSENIEQRGT